MCGAHTLNQAVADAPACSVPVAARLHQDTLLEVQLAPLVTDVRPEILLQVRLHLRHSRQNLGPAHPISAGASLTAYGRQSIWARRRRTSRRCFWHRPAKVGNAPPPPEELLPDKSASPNLGDNCQAGTPRWPVIWNGPKMTGGGGRSGPDAEGRGGRCCGGC